MMRDHEDVHRAVCLTFDLDVVVHLDRERDRRAVEGHAKTRGRRRARRDLLLVQVGDVVTDDGDAPSNVGPATDERPWDARERSARDVELAIGGRQRGEVEERRGMWRGGRGGSHPPPPPPPRGRVPPPPLWAAP